MTRPFYILPLLFLSLLSGAVGYVKAHRAAPVAAQDGRSEAIAPVGDVAPVGVLQSPPSLSAAQIDAILASYGSPATGEGESFYNLGIQYGIDPAYALAFFVMESSAGTDPRWDGHKPDGTTTHDIGNISCAGYPTCYGRWRDYDSWRTGIEDWYRLISVEFIDGRGHQTVDDVIPVYAPAFENDVGGYTNTVSALVGKWRAEYGGEETQPVFLQRADITPDWQQRVNPDARFSTINCGAWGFQSGCQHFGTDILGNGEGTPVYAPYGGTYTGCQDNGDGGPYIGKWIEYTADDGVQFLINHFRDSPFCGAAVGTRIDAGAFIGTMRGDANHVHVQISVSGQLVDFEEYWNSH